MDSHQPPCQSFQEGLNDKGALPLNAKGAACPERTASGNWRQFDSPSLIPPPTAYAFDSFQQPRRHTDGSLRETPQMVAPPRSKDDDSLFGCVAYEGLSLQDEIKNLRAIDIQGYERYQRGYCYPVSHYTPWKNTVTPGPLATPFEGDRPPEGWVSFVHPQGTRYFYHDHPSSPVPVITEAWLYDTEVVREVKGYIAAIFQYMRRRGISYRPAAGAARPDKVTRGGGTIIAWNFFQFTAPVVLVLEERLNGEFGYYFVDHTQRRLFWLDKYDFGSCAKEVQIEHTKTLLDLEMMSQYWKHVEHFPHLYEFTQADLARVDDMISSAFGAVLTSDKSAVNCYNLDQLKHVQDILTRHKRKDLSGRSQSVGERRTICQVVSDLYHEMFLNLHGERGVRLDCRQSIHCSPYRRVKWTKRLNVKPEANESRPWHHRLSTLFSGRRVEARSETRVGGGVARPQGRTSRTSYKKLLMDLASILMFGGPRLHAHWLREAALDRIVNKARLTRYMDKLVGEWRDVSLYGMVLLGANVSFLAIQSVDEASPGLRPKTPAQRASYFSILASLSTIASSLVLLILARYRHAAKLLQMRGHSEWAPEALALMYSTPFGLVIWSLLGFLGSFLILWVQCRDGLMLGLIITFFLLFASFLGWVLSASHCAAVGQYEVDMPVAPVEMDARGPPASYALAYATSRPAPTGAARRLFGRSRGFESPQAVAGDSASTGSLPQWPKERFAEVGNIGSREACAV